MSMVGVTAIDFRVCELLNASALNTDWAEDASVIVVASLLKAGAAAGGVLVLVMLLEQPTWTTFGFVAGWYVVLTGVQVGVAGWAFWRRDAQRVESAAAGSSVTAPPP